jgi:hypothetical protein
MPSVYIETTIPSFYCETRTSPVIVAWREVTRRWWDNDRRGYALYASAYVRAELSDAPERKSKRALALLSEVPDLEDPPGLEELAEYYIEHRLMPLEAGGDAVHLAMASLHRLDFLLTWNCRHLANANKIQHLAVLNGRLGLHIPTVTTPLTLIAEESI